MKTSTKSILGGRVEVIGPADCVGAVASHIETTISGPAAAVQPLKPVLDDATALVEWHEASMGNHQGLIIDANGRNVAVAYDKADAPLIAAAPELLAFAESMVAWLQINGSTNHQANLLKEAQAAITKAKGQL